jgi:hypothetical protein
VPIEPTWNHLKPTPFISSLSPFVGTSTCGSRIIFFKPRRLSQPATTTFHTWRPRPSTGLPTFPRGLLSANASLPSVLFPKLPRLVRFAYAPCQKVRVLVRYPCGSGPDSMPGTSPADRANCPSRNSSASGDDEYTPHSRSDVYQANRDAPSKRKRGRVNPAQLAYLERAYTADRSLDATRRKEISQKLGMDERQTQIWFQNRRAKAKMLAHRAKEGGGEPDTPGTPIGFSVPPTLEDIKATLQEDTRTSSGRLVQIERVV